MIVPVAAFHLVKTFEGLRLKPYKDAVGFPTIGYGHKILPGEGDLSSITFAHADDLLNLDLSIAARAVLKYTSVSLKENQLASLISFVFNLGSGTYQRSTLRMKLNRGDYKAVPSELKRYIYASGIKLPGLVRRREAESFIWSQS